MRQSLVFTPSITSVKSLSLIFNLKKVIGVLLFLAILSLLTISIIQLNAYTKEIYLIGEYENKLVQLERESKFLEINFSKANSLNNLGGFVQNQVFEKADKVEYIRVLGDTAMAK